MCGGLCVRGCEADSQCVCISAYGLYMIWCVCVLGLDGRRLII